MITVSFKEKDVPKDMITLVCHDCGKKNVYFRDEMDKDGYTRCISCNCLLPDVDALIYNRKFRIIHHIRHSEHFVR